MATARSDDQLVPGEHLVPLGERQWRERNLDGARTPIGADLLRGQSVTVNAAVTARRRAGGFVLKLDLVQESSRVLREGRGHRESRREQAGPVVATFGPTTGSFRWTGSGGESHDRAGHARQHQQLHVVRRWWRNPVTLSYHWITARGRRSCGTASHDASGLMSRRSADAASGRPRVPSAPGTYLLRWDLVQEGVSWFSGKVYAARADRFGAAFVARSSERRSAWTRQPATMGAKLTVSVPVKIENCRTSTGART